MSALSNGDLINPFTYSEPGMEAGFLGPSVVMNETLRTPRAGVPSHDESNTRFPFSRLAWTTFPNTTTIYIYHQLNETTLAEEALTDIGWSTRIIPVPMV